MPGSERKPLLDEIVDDSVAVQPAANRPLERAHLQVLLVRTRSDDVAGTKFGLNVPFDASAEAGSRLLRTANMLGRPLVDHAHHRVLRMSQFVGDFAVGL